MMKKFIGCLLSVGIALTQSQIVQAAQVEVQWSNPDKYTDIDPGQEHRQRFKDRTFKEFEKHFAKLAESLPENQKLLFDITNVDLAGDVNFGSMQRIRIVKSIFFPRMEFSYQLLNADNTVIKSEAVALKDMGFLNHTRLKYNHQFLSYEKELLDDWFKKTFAN